MQISEMSYQAIEPKHNRIRLAKDINCNIYIISNDDIPFSAPYHVAHASKELYRFSDGMQIMLLKDDEVNWIIRLSGFVNSLSAGPMS
jgi:hypothetical protein